MTENLKKFMKESGFVSIEEVANTFEITATEFDPVDKEIGRDYMIAAATLRENERLTKALSDCYMLACRQLRRPNNLKPEDWQHIKRFCEETGLKPQILRAAVPTEITGG